MFVRQILADRLTKSSRLFRIKWKGINKNGATWEPSSHLIGQNATTILNAYLAKLIEDKKRAEARKAALLAGELVETGASDPARADGASGSGASGTGGAGPSGAGGSGVPAGDTAPGTVAANKNAKDRLNASTVWQYYGKWFWDNSSTPARKVASCTLCDRKISAASTTNLKAHLMAKHAKQMVHDLQVAAADVGNDDLADLIKGATDFKQGKVDRFTGQKKRNLDESYVKWCCKKKRGLSLGETDREFKAFIQQISGGRYSPPCRRTALDILVHMTAKAKRKVVHDMKKLREQGVCPSISGTACLFGV